MDYRKISTVRSTVVAGILLAIVPCYLLVQHGRKVFDARRVRAIALSLTQLVSYALPTEQRATVTWSDVHQTIDGFGGSCADFVRPLTPRQADFFFTASGIGLSLLRTQIIPDAATCDAYFSKGGCSDSNGQLLNGEMTTAREAVARGVTVWSAPWSPPGAYKSNGSFTQGGFLLPAHYVDWAGDMARYVTMMRDRGVPVYAVSVQNEPDLSTPYGSCLYTGRQIHDFLPLLHAALAAAGAGSTKIMIAEQANWNADLTFPAMSDPEVAPTVGIIAAHGYGQATIQPFPTGTARLWQTEDSSQSATYDGSIGDGLTWAEKIHSYLTVANVNAWHWWFLTDMVGQGEGADNAALTDIHGNYPKRAYVTGQWSRFVRPGWVRIGATYSGPIQISAFKDPKSVAFALVAVNSLMIPVRREFVLSGFSTNSVNPWMTSASLSLAPQAAVPVKDGSFTYTLPAASVTTFSGQVRQ